MVPFKALLLLVSVSLAFSYTSSYIHVMISLLGGPLGKHPDIFFK